MAITSSSDERTVALLRVASLEWRGPPGPLRGVEESGTPWGNYEGLPPKIELLPDGRRARLLAALSFTQPDGQAWPVPAGVELDGASIPRFAWTLIGGPFEGCYRDASIVHDHYCVVRTRTWQATHNMFHDAMRASGESAVKAKIMYYAVYRFGPRWGDGQELSSLDPLAVTEAMTGAEDSASRGEGIAEIESFAADAEAIYRHDLSLAEIEALADARNAIAGGGAVVASVTEAGTPEMGSAEAASVEEGVAETVSIDRVRLLIVTGGSGTVEDLEAVAQEAALLPAYVVDKFERKGIRLVACRESVTDFEVALRGVQPRGWPKGSTWDSVPGAYFNATSRVVIATIKKGGRRVVPGKGNGHGSASLTVHEALHGFDYAGNHAVLSLPAFIAARTADKSRLGSYERQEGQAGLEETFAESGARFVVAPGQMSSSWKHLFEFWRGAPFSSPELALELASILESDDGSAGADAHPIGMAQMRDGGAIELDLRAEGEGGAIGHATLLIAPDSPEFTRVKEHVFGPGEASTLDAVPFRPMTGGS